MSPIPPLLRTLDAAEVTSVVTKSFFASCFFLLFFFYVVDHFIANGVVYPVLACYQLEIEAKQGCF